ncbi:hypothetical protein [Streptomyces californicus]|uniref:hypothetical protein n=1 Tax=Streptomyces californicus TaxID=67351 RepID=UPI0036805406
MAQLFTGLRGGDDAHAEDVDLYLQILDELWAPSTTGNVFAARMEALEEFPELQPFEEGLVDAADIYAFYAVPCMRYAVLCRTNGDPEDAVRLLLGDPTSGVHFGVVDEFLSRFG